MSGMIGKLGGFFVAGGPFMWAILFTWIIGLAIMIERFKFLWAASSVEKDEVLSHVNSYVLQGNIEKAVAMTSQIRSPLTNIIRAGLVSIVNSGDPEEVQTAMDAVALREIPKIEKRIGLLATLSNIATLLGLLGTVTGLIGAFASVADAAPAEKAAKLAIAIAEAMNTTAFGLIAAIPLLAGFGYLNSKAQDLTDDIHESAVATLNFILTNRSRIQVKK
jgi:biopolymer transport protein ExbB/TolQ